MPPATTRRQGPSCPSSASSAHSSGPNECQRALGYGASEAAIDGQRWSKRRAGAAIHALMNSMGYDRYSIVGHDRGARVGYRMALDYPDAVRSFASLAVVPTLDAMSAIDFREAAARFHWFFLAQPGDLPERLLAAEPNLFLDRALDGMAGGRPFLEEAARRAYHLAFRRHSVRHAICEDYRAALNEDLAADRADRDAERRIACPVLSLWPAAGHSGDGRTPLEIWKEWSSEVSDAALPGGHLLAEESPSEVLAELLPFLDRQHG
ncbi:alpha/beta fold hydrolase [Phaeospirillum tilakii]|uniref:Alpha/beta fold hydrolase n=1 Tax=Phaeospirillum tilakii TaxID=741673 RepID=A0ABW5CIJ1_9PROT